MNRKARIVGLACLAYASAAMAQDPPGAPDDHFLCYKAVITKDTPKFVAVEGVNAPHLTDAYAPPDDFEVTKPVWMCDPADVGGGGIVNSTIHLDSYKIKAVKNEPAPTPQLNVKLVNQINPGGLIVDTKKPELLLVPSAVDTNTMAAPPAPSPGSHNVDLYKCYSIKISKGQPKFPKGIQVDVSSQFTPTVKTLDVKKPKRLCLPVSKNGSVIKNAGGYLTCYQVKPAKDEPKHVPVTVRVGNEFLQGETLTTKKDAELCVASILPVCGDGVKNDITEDCDGTDDMACPGQCSSLCFCRQQLPFVINPSTSLIQVRGANALGAGVDRDLFLSGLSGTITINIDGPIAPIGSANYQISVPVTALPPVDVDVPGFGVVARACVFLTEDPDLPGSGLAGTGVLNCFGSFLLSPLSPDFNVYEDHCTNATSCDSLTPLNCAGALGAGGKIHSATGECVPAAPIDATCTASDLTDANLEDVTDQHPGVCNSPLYGRAGLSSWAPGDALLTLSAAVEIRGPGDPCTGVPSTDPIKGPLTTGTVVTSIMDVMPNIAPAAGKVQAIKISGARFTCGVSGSPPTSTSGAALVTGAAILDLPLPSPLGLADINTALKLVAQ